MGFLDDVANYQAATQNEIMSNRGLKFTAKSFTSFQLHYMWNLQPINERPNGIYTICMFDKNSKFEYI